MPGVEDMSAITNEGLAIEIKNLSIQIADLKAVMATQSADYIRKEVFELRIKDIDAKIVANQLKIVEVEKSTRKSNWKTHTLTAAFSIFITLLITYVFNDLVAR